ncbi:acetate uptake transporter [Candidatus Fermentibacterales bacterium]|nr:acetate uptake transporter [Candidatus Fermentibacterales bacterium]
MGESRANPAPLGLMGFGMTTVLLNIHNAGLFAMDTMILSMGIFYGGLAQIIAGIMEFRNGNTFGLTAFTSYGLFWLSLVFIVLKGGADPVFMGWYLFMWGLFTGYMWLGTWRKNRALQTVFLSLTVLFWLLAIGHWADSTVFVRIAGWEGIFCGMSAVYLAAAEVLSEARGKALLPIGVVGRR